MLGRLMRGRAQGAAAAVQAGQTKTETEPETEAEAPPETPRAPAVATAEQAPIAGVSLDLYARISRALAADGFDQSNATHVAAAFGVGDEAWDAAVDGWNRRITASPDVASAFNAFYIRSM